ncbi:hypothetical protein [Nocardioides alcanivorans]|uniref:hypothetical protein n=1 Tax=Nocardioides alcanivorans TaxID=2897352 RepID=UPI001F3DDD2D|nr:hypothetical protein [Nocardioides alcanivorans]
MSDNDKLRHELTRRSGVMADAQLDFDAMRDEARSIRRRRRIGTGIAAAAVLAVIAVPTTLVINETRNDSSPGPADTITRTPDQDPSPPAPDRPTSVPDDKEASVQALEDMPVGEAPTVEYLHGDTIHLRDGSEVPAPETAQRITAISGYHGGWLVAEEGSDDDHADATFRQYDASGSEVSTTPGNPMFAVSNDGTQLAWWTWNSDEEVGELHSASPSGMGEGDGPVQETGDASWVVPIGYLASGELVYGATKEGGGQVTRVTDFAGKVRDIDGLASVSSTDQLGNRIAGQTTRGQRGDELRAIVVDGTTGEELWHKDGWSLGRFSPDGEHVIGYESGPDPMKVAILDADDGTVVTQVDLHGDHGLGYDEVVWNDDSSLAIEAYVFAGTDAEPHPGAVLLLDTEDTLTRATDVDAGDDGWVFLPTP